VNLEECALYEILSRISVYVDFSSKILEQFYIHRDHNIQMQKGRTTDKAFFNVKQ